MKDFRMHFYSPSAHSRYLVLNGPWSSPILLLLVLLMAAEHHLFTLLLLLYYYYYYYYYYFQYVRLVKW